MNYFKPWTGSGKANELPVRLGAQQERQKLTAHQAGRSGHEECRTAGMHQATAASVETTASVTGVKVYPPVRHTWCVLPPYSLGKVMESRFSNGVNSQETDSPF